RVEARGSGWLRVGPAKANGNVCPLMAQGGGAKTPGSVNVLPTGTAPPFSSVLLTSRFGVDGGSYFGERGQPQPDFQAWKRLGDAKTQVVSQRFAVIEPELAATGLDHECLRQAARYLELVERVR